MYQSIFQFWFEEITPAQWWKADSDFDAVVAKRFGAIHQQAFCTELFG